MKALMLILATIVAASAPAQTDKLPAIEKKGTIGVDLCETTPFVLRGRLYRLEWHRKASRLRIIDHDQRTEVSHFGDHYRFPSALVEGNTVYVIATKETHGWCGDTLTMFSSSDLTNWNERVAYRNPDFRMCNTSVCKADDRYMMSVEVTKGGFSGRFLESKDLIHWTLLPPECIVLRQSAHCFRYHDGWYYLFSTVGGYKAQRPGEYGGHVMVLNRSHDLMTWEASPFNPVLVGSDEDKRIFNPDLTRQDRADIAGNAISNNSDIDFCEYAGRLIINYCWGTQGGPGHEYIAEAEYAGTEAKFLARWFP